MDARGGGEEGRGQASRGMQVGLCIMLVYVRSCP